ncbi:MAG: hemerythrin domain-containing protein [Alphaproteobacteria bacterium]
MNKYVLPAAFSIRYGTIDQEHGQLIGQLNVLSATAARGAAAEVRQQAGAFTRALREHFANEEALMAELGYPRLTEHREHHGQCLARIAGTLDRACAQGQIEGTEIDAIFSLLVDTVARVDLYFEEYLIGIGLVSDHPKLS